MVGRKARRRGEEEASGYSVHSARKPCRPNRGKAVLLRSSIHQPLHFTSVWKFYLTCYKERKYNPGRIKNRPPPQAFPALMQPLVTFSCISFISQRFVKHFLANLAKSADIHRATSERPCSFPLIPFSPNRKFTSALKLLLPSRIRHYCLKDSEAVGPKTLSDCVCVGGEVGGAGRGEGV